MGLRAGVECAARRELSRLLMSDVTFSPWSWSSDPLALRHWYIHYLVALRIYGHCTVL